MTVPPAQPKDPQPGPFLATGRERFTDVGLPTARKGFSTFGRMTDRVAGDLGRKFPERVAGQDRPIASLDCLGDTGELRAQAEDALGRSDDVSWTGRSEGADESGSITVAIEARGQVAVVAVSRQWREHLEVGRFADALFEAYTAAVRAMFEAAAFAALAAEQETKGAASRPSSPAVDSVMEEHEWLRAVWAILDGNDAASMWISAMGASDRRERTLVSPRGYLALHVRGHGLERITGDVWRIAVADAPELGRDALIALQAIAPARERSNDFGSTNAT